MHLLRGPYRDVWVRFHSLPGSKRYPENEDRYAVVLERHNTILDELFAGTDVYLITPAWTTEPDAPPCHGDAEYWESRLVTDDPDPEYRTPTSFRCPSLSWCRGCLDDLLRDVANDKAAGALVTDVLI
ncbi:DUF3885 domain-containing protein [Streptomyces malaysiensis]